MSLIAESCLPRNPPRQTSRRRVVVNVVAAMIVTALEVALFTIGMRRNATPPFPNPIAVHVVTLPAPMPPADAMPMIETGAPAPQPQPTIAPPPQPPAPEAMPMIETPPAVVETPPPVVKPLSAPTQVVPPIPAVPSPKPRAPPRHEARQARPVPALPPREASPSAGPPNAIPAPPLSGGGTMGARAIYKPTPDIPEELRHHPMTLVAMARFRVAADGGTTVELIEPTASPLLNRALLAALQRWRFFPAMNNGQSVASTIDIRIPVEIR